MPFTLVGAKTAHLNGVAGLAASANLQVDAGATFDALCVKKGIGRMPYGDLGYVFDAAFASGDLSGWKVVVDGVEKPLITLAWEDGKLMLRPGGLVTLV